MGAPRRATDIAIDAGRGLLLLREGSTMRSVSLATLETVDVDVPAVGRGEQVVAVGEGGAEGGSSTTRADRAPPMGGDS